MERRAFLTAGLAAAATSALLPLSACARLAGLRAGPRGTAGKAYGPLAPVRDDTTGLPLLWLPEGFRYLTFGWAGDMLSDGTATPPMHDGMAAFGLAPNRVRLIRNHEVRITPARAAARSDAVYDPAAAGGTTTLDFDTATGRVLESRISLTGTSVNCAGGPTPWGSWLSCEETMEQPGPTRAARPHGYIFEVPLHGATQPEPLGAMGRFVHEAIAIDPVTGVVYETEDRQDSGFYRFTPHVRGSLSKGGRLEMLAIERWPRYDTRTGQIHGRPLRVSWVAIDRPDDPANPDPAAVFAQGFASGGAVFARLEGAWYGDGRIFFVSTNGGTVKLGQVFAFDPVEQELTLVFESPGPLVARNIDNVTMSPRGGLFLCEDGGPQAQRVHAMTPEGRIVPFAQNNIVLDGEKHGLKGDFRVREFAGATFSPDGNWLFVNAQTPGITFAITGDWSAAGF
ncbi:MAG: PhoX family protein [Acidobacteriota bacterium]|nr:PhoX family protein [Acidobacteriota bacterium]